MPFTLDSDGILRVPEWIDLLWLAHGFTTPAAGDFSRRRLDETQTAASVCGSEMRLRTLRQVHSNHLVALNGDRRTADAPDDPEADGLITSRPGELVAVRTADCVPILLLDPREQVVAAIHAGWRGTAARIAENAVTQATAEFACDPKDLEAAIGPAIGACCFEVGEEVAARFDPSLVRRSSRPHVDLIEANRRQLIEAGLRERKIRIADACTFCAPALLYSFRRQGAESGRMLAFAGIREQAAG